MGTVAYVYVVVQSETDPARWIAYYPRAATGERSALYWNTDLQAFPLMMFDMNKAYDWQRAVREDVYGSRDVLNVDGQHVVVRRIGAGLETQTMLDESDEFWTDDHILHFPASYVRQAAHRWAALTDDGWGDHAGHFVTWTDEVLKPIIEAAGPRAVRVVVTFG